MVMSDEQMDGEKDGQMGCGNEQADHSEQWSPLELFLRQQPLNTFVPVKFEIVK
jgi:hypothetical protein